MLTDTSVTLLSERRRGAPYGARGGAPGGRGRNTLIRDGQTKPLPGKMEMRLRAGDRLRVETPGGGGYGDSFGVRIELRVRSSPAGRNSTRTTMKTRLLMFSSGGSGFGGEARARRRRRSAGCSTRSTSCSTRSSLAVR